ncbi:MAG: OmpA family protein [Ignavibacteria bacterium]|nr:OmpA family protein [Ignavibacteria bacterium]
MSKFTDSKHASAEAKRYRGNYYFIILIVSIMIIFVLSVVINIQSRELYEKIPLDSLSSAEVCYFDFGESELKSESLPVLEKIAAMLKKNPENKLEIIGHTDNAGSDEFNYELSLKRAEEVKKFLISAGCPENQINTIAKGKQEPVNLNATDFERALNRRVELNLLIPQKMAEDKDIEFVNSVFNQQGRNELKGEISVRDSSGMPIENIKEEDVTAVLKWERDNTEDSTAGKVNYIPIDDKKKLAFSLTMDYSGSMYGSESDLKTTPKSDKVIAMESAVKTFIKELKGNMFCKIVKFGFDVNEIIRYSKSREVLERAVDDASYPRGGTALYSSIYACMRDTSFDSNPTVMKTVIAFTDGMENSSKKITIDSVFNLSFRKNIKIFTVGLFSDIKGFEVDAGIKERGVMDLQSIAATCGGFFYRAGNSTELSGIYKSIFEQILKSYQVSIIWNEEKLPPKGTKVKAVVRINVNGKTRVLYKNYTIE